MSSPKMVIKTKEYSQDVFLSGLSAVSFAILPAGFLMMMTPQNPVFGIITAAASFIASPLVYKGVGGDTMKDQISNTYGRGAYGLSPTFKEKRELVSRNEKTGEETYLVRKFTNLIVETHTPENPGKTWDRVYDSLLKVHDLKETDFLVYAEVEDNSKAGSHGKLLPWKHSINKAMAFTGYGIACECKACS